MTRNEIAEYLLLNEEIRLKENRREELRLRLLELNGQTVDGYAIAIEPVESERFVSLESAEAFGFTRDRLRGIGLLRTQTARLIKVSRVA